MRSGRDDGDDLPGPTSTAPTPATSPSDPPPRRDAEPVVRGDRRAAHGRHPHGATLRPSAAEPWGVCAGQPGCTETTADDSIDISYTVPDGWAFGFRAAVTKPSAGTVAPSGMSLHFLRGGWLFSDPCLKVDTLPDIEVGPTADDFADALASHPSSIRRLRPMSRSADLREVPRPSGAVGHLRVHSRVLPVGTRLLCPGAEPPMARLEPRCRRRPRGDPERDFARTLPQDLAEMHAIIESIQIEP